MERLTEREAYWFGEEFWISAKEPDDEKIDEVYMKLKHYEDLEEQGLLRKVEHGEWKTESELFFPIYRCSECNCASALGQTKFCPNCGAKMRELENE